ncbi:hypothetical protein C8R45DRAFT_936645 [Mycena sanguinolenta]|nr:hypothetical protein C8R45DRAFT_936645 [Mycena sanguinolenta]
MPPSRSSAVRRPGPARLPPYIHLPPLTRKDRLREKKRHDAEEHERRAANERVRVAKIARDAAPDNAILQMKYQQALEDYEDNFTLWIEDEALAKWFAKKQEAEAILRRLERVALDTHPYNDPAPLRNFNSKYAAFVREYGTTFILADEDRLAKLRDELEVHDQLMATFGGDTDALRAEFARKYCSITIRNPFASLDVPFAVRALYATFTGKNEGDIPPTLDLPKFLISLANPFYDRPDGKACIALYYQRRRRNLPKCSQEINRGGERARARDFGSAPRCAAELLRASLDNEGVQERASALRIRPEIGFRFDVFILTRQARAYILTDERKMGSITTLRNGIVAPSARRVRWTRRFQKPEEVDAVANIFILQLTAHGVDGEAGLDFEHVDEHLQSWIKNAGGTANDVQIAAEILVPRIGEVSERLVDRVPNTRTDEREGRKVQEGRDSHGRELCTASALGGGGLWRLSVAANTRPATVSATFAE